MATAMAAAAARRHGCEAPLHPSQAAVVGVGLLSAAVFYALSVRELPARMQSTLARLYSVQFAVTALLFVVVRALSDGCGSYFIDLPRVSLAAQISRFDPGPATYQAAQSTAANEMHVAVPTAASVVVVTTAEPKASAGMPSHSVVATCSDCGRVALTSDTRHCGRCNKCIPGYDHHCIYLNTCIGTRNYPLFVGLLSCSILLLLTQQVVTGYAIACLLDREREEGRKARALLLCLLSVLPLLELLFLVVLGSFHLYITFRGLTTYEWLYQWLEQRSPNRAATDITSTAANATEQSCTPL